jgi:hypothetical protein
MGKICIKCGIEKSIYDFYRHSGCSDGRRPSCISCAAEYSKINKVRVNKNNAGWRNRNKSKVKALAAAYYRRNKEKVAEYARANRARRNELGAAWKARNKSKVRASSAAYYQRNMERCDAATAAWWCTHVERRREKDRRYPETSRARGARRRARVIGVGGLHTAVEAFEVLVKQGFRCNNPYCLADLRSCKRHKDHRTPLIRHGSNDAINLQWLCAPCNLTKHTKTQDEWLRMLEGVDAWGIS